MYEGADSHKKLEMRKTFRIATIPLQVDGSCQAGNVIPLDAVGLHTAIGTSSFHQLIGFE